MALETKPFGLIARRSDIGGVPTTSVRLPVSASYNTPLYKGDVVTINAGNAELLSNTAATQGAAIVYGAVAQVGYIRADGTPVIGKVLPASTPASSQVDGTMTPWVDVEMGQGGLFTVLSNATGTAALTAANTLGKFFGLITNGTPDAVMGQSAVALQPKSGTTYGTTDGGSTTITDRTVQVVGLVGEPNNSFGDANLKLVVRFIKTPINQ